MYIVTVEFRVKPQHVDAFVSAVLKQAAASRMEEGCREFVVMQHTAEKQWVHLYEVYDNRQCFEEHCSMPHFLSFSDLVASWIVEKRVNCFKNLEEY
ncbi:putative quinol monooxygenase [Bythopirellula polymerisocia]|uniref:Autoinducer-2 (AI-2) modifying protein LsrG n=1 Tax=Bythopirellula polymerisocia TaxID=2528003 RepID=A0A5C6CYM3_9BACT|nr:autoinducer-2 (AI-2) modifying protein LsrG [Bythopirellula polymerisocia]